MNLNAIKLCVGLILMNGASCMAQISQGGWYSGKIGANDIIVAVGKQDAVNVFYLDYFTRSLDVVLTGLNSTNSSSGFSSRGRSYSFQVRDGVARGTFGGQAFTANRESGFGPYFKEAGGYNGVIQDNRLEISLMVVGFFSTGKVFLLRGTGNGDIAGIGQVSSAGQVSVPMTDGNIYSFVFRPDPLLLVTSRGTISVNGVSQLTYLLYNNTSSRLVNISTRGNVTPAAPMTAGFVITDSAKTVLIRGIGPALTQFGVVGACPDTQLRLFSGQSVISTNDDWGRNANSREIPLGSSQVGAFPLVSGSRDAVLMVTLEPGAYTVEVAAQGAAGGEVLVEVYGVD